MRKITAADLFCGAGGASTAARLACQRLGLGLELVAINHWPIAIATHSANHPGARHLCASIEHVRPRDVVPSGRLNLLLAAPECTQHSRARGGRPINDQQRISATKIIDWVTDLYVDRVLIENVEEFREWGPLAADGRPMPSKRGEAYRGFLSMLERVGYRVEDRVLNAADYGDATTRRRLFIQAVRGRGRIDWPVPSHSRTGQATLHGSTEQWRPAREVIDWSLPSQSIFGRKKPLSENTVARIVEGLKRFGGKRLEPFVMHLTHGGRLHDLGSPLPTITSANRGELALVQPFVLGQQSGGAPRGVSAPLPTIATAGAQALVEAFLVPMYGERDGQTPRVHSLNEPVPTIPASAVKVALVEPFLLHYYSTGGVTSVNEPVPTVTTRDRFALVQPVIDGIALEILLRMLQPHELAAAMSFPSDYRFAGTAGDRVRQIGNAWPVRTGQALVETMLEAA